MPSPEMLKSHKHLQFMGERLHNPNLWHLTRHSVANAFAIGLFFAWIPFPGQMIMAALGAFYFRGNLPISVALVWLTNPITIPPLFYFAYKFGVLLLGQELPEAHFEFTVENVLAGLSEIGAPLVVGSLVLAISCSLLGYFGIQLIWRYSVLKRWQSRDKGKKENNKFT